MTLIEQLAAFAANTGYNKLPLDVVEECKRDILDAKGRLLVPGGMAHRMHEVRLAEARRTVHEQWVVQHARRVGHRLGSGDSEAVGRASDESVEAEALIEFH